MTTVDQLVSVPGVYDIPEDVYHGDPVAGGSLSSSGARALLPPSCPARFAWEQKHPQPRKVFDYGKAAHMRVLGEGPEIVPVNARDWRTNAAKALRDEAHDAGKVPLLVHELVEIDAMAAALRAHPIAAALFRPGRGSAEQSLFWIDEKTGIWCRARYDWFPHRQASGRLIIPDYKTSLSADPEHIRRAVYTYGYHQQGRWYLDGAEALKLAEPDEAAFVFVVQEKTAPYLVTVVELDSDALAVGTRRNERAREVYRDCVESGVWPGYTTDVVQVGLPAWVNRNEEF